jgi:hypothetical protein
LRTEGYNICVQPLQHVQVHHTSKTFETLEIDDCNMHF